jgi:phosphoglycolate phosphatase-like HAD superfamily hydrolase
MSASNALPSWHDGAARTAILDFVERVTAEGGADYVPPSERIAVFDNDGTLWCEKPGYVQAYFLLERLGQQAAEDPAMAEDPVVQALLAGDLHAAMTHGIEALGAVLLRTHAGWTADEFNATAREWLGRARDPATRRAFAELRYVPMLELLALLRERGFAVFIVTGGGVEFVRAASEDLYGVPPQNVVGTAVQLAFERREGRVVLVRQPAALGDVNEGPPKATAIQQHVGRRPIFAAGNSAGDTEMLEFTATGDLPSLCVVVQHDDQEREHAYAGTAMTNPKAEAIEQTAPGRGWTVVSMRDDWARVFADP